MIAAFGFHFLLIEPVCLMTRSSVHQQKFASVFEARLCLSKKRLLEVLELHLKLRLSVQVAIHSTALLAVSLSS